MKWLPAKVGAEPKKLAALGGLLAVLLVVFITNRDPGVPEQSAPVSAPSAAPAPLKSLPVRSASAPPSPLPPQRTNAARRDNAAIVDFKPSLKLPEGADVSRIDPSLKLDLLARLQQLPAEGGERSLFEFGTAPKPKEPTPTVAPVKPQPPPGTASAAGPSATPTAPPKPAVAPIPLKFYGYVGDAKGTSKRALFLDGDDIVVAGENDMIRDRYKVIRIGVNSAVIEDTTNKNQQTLPLVEELAG
ncbi:MAG: hypothetical protein EXQ47_00385 [Bryobacterales bacterium]|nr:hypothetical protein [Bryobacterales bacterium]